MYAPELFVKHLSDFLKPGKKLIFSVPNMRVMLERKYTNCLNFEHTIYLSEDYIEYLLAKYGFRVLERQYFLDDHSVFYSAIRDIETESTELPVNLYRINKKLYFEYLQFHEKLVAEINKQLIKIENSRTFLFGAHVQAQYLIGFGLNLDKIEAILDNDINKQGKRLFGTNKLVAEPSILGGLESPTVILRAGTFTNEVVAQIKSINSTTLFIL
jgi:hypothetical protein